MSDGGRWVPLPEGQVPAEGQRVRTVLEGVVEGVRPTCFRYRCMFIIPSADYVVSVEVWEPAENLIPGKWYRDANGQIALRLNGPPPVRWMTTNGIRFAEEEMVRPLSIARWGPVQ